MVLLLYNLDEFIYWFDIIIFIVEIKLILKLSFLCFMVLGLVFFLIYVGVDRNLCFYFDLDFYFYGNGMMKIYCFYYEGIMNFFFL